MTHSVIAFLDGVGRHNTAILHRVAPNAYGGGGSPAFYSSPNKENCHLFNSALTTTSIYGSGNCGSPLGAVGVAVREITEIGEGRRRRRSYRRSTSSSLGLSAAWSLNHSQVPVILAVQ